MLSWVYGQLAPHKNTPMNTVIKYYSRSVYGTTRNYVADPIVARAIENLTRQTTLSESHMSALSALGLTWEQVIDPSLVSRAKYGVTTVPGCSCTGSFHDDSCPLRIA